MKPFELRIGLTRSTQSPSPGIKRFKERHGGPDVLLDWLEDQLSLGAELPERTNRILEYSHFLENYAGSSYRESLSVDRWATAADLLDRRDELLMKGWDAQPDSSYPQLVNDLAAVEQNADVPAGLPDRLEAVREALQSGQTLAPHQIILSESIDDWPCRWRSILERLDIDVQAGDEAQAQPDCVLRSVQDLLGRSMKRTDLDLDDSFRIIQANSDHRACALISNMLQQSSFPLDRTVIVCRKEGLQSRLEESLRQSGLPGPGITSLGQSQPVLQLLPLMLEMLWEPVDPQTLMDFLSLPVTPIPEWAARRFRNALAEMPGFKSQRWEEAHEECLQQAHDPDELAEKLQDWLDHGREVKGDTVPVERVVNRCKLLANWARGKAETMGEEASNLLQQSLKTAASIASGLKGLVLERNEPLSKPQLDRMREDIENTVSALDHYEASGSGPIVVGTLADIPENGEHVIWLGVTTEERPVQTWTAAQRTKLKDNGIEIDFDKKQRRLKREAEQRGIRRISQSLSVIQLTQNNEDPSHPLWVRIKNALPENFEDNRDLSVEAYLDEGLSSPFDLHVDEFSYHPPQPRRALWDVPNSLIGEPDYSSASELQERLACPAKWLFKRAAGLRSSSAASIPSSFRLKGRFAHQLFEHIFDQDGERPDPEEARAAVVERFDERIERDAAPLAEVSRYGERQSLREDLGRSARRFVEVLQRGGYQVEGMEVSLASTMMDRPMRGQIDCVLVGENGNEAVVDFKYAGSRYRDLLEEGRALQLAVYCEDRRQQLEEPGRIEGTGYFIFTDSRLYTPQGRMLRGSPETDTVEEAPDIYEVWDDFQEALDRSEQWLHDGEAVPARPLQDEKDWPDGADMAIETGRDDRDELRPCTYCEYDVLCGLRTCD